MIWRDPTKECRLTRQPSFITNIWNNLTKEGGRKRANLSNFVNEQSL